VYQIDVKVSWDDRRQVEVNMLRTMPLTVQTTAPATPTPATPTPATPTRGPRPATPATR